MTHKIPYGKQWISKEDINAVASILSSDFLTCGPAVENFEKALCELIGARHAIACSNGTTALHLACLGLEIGKNDLGITSPITFLASANCVEFCGGRMDFADIDSNNLCLSPKEVDQYCKNIEIPKVVIPVDFAGVPSELPEFKALSKRYGFKIIEDAAHAIGSTYTFEGKEYACGSCAHSDVAIFSFHPVKTVTTGEGGAVLTNDDQVAQRIRLLRSHGMERNSKRMTHCDGPWYYEMTELGYNYRITDLQCGLGIFQLKRLHEFKKLRAQIVRAYNDVFRNDSNLIIPPAPSNYSPCYHLYPLQINGGSSKRLAVFERLKDQGILCQIHYIPVYWQPYYRKKYSYPRGKCPRGEDYYSKCISLPLFPAMTDNDIAYVIEKTIEAVRD